MENKTITIKCKGGDIKGVKPEIIKYLITFQNLIDDLEEENDSDEIEISCPLEVELVNKTIEFAKENYDNLNIKVNSIDDLSEIEKKYIPKDQNEHSELIKTCNFLQFDYMLEILCKSIGLKIRVMPADKQKELLKHFN